jgi:uncharacterized membrane protein
LNASLAAIERSIRPLESRWTVAVETTGVVLFAGADVVWCDGLELALLVLVGWCDGLELALLVLVGWCDGLVLLELLERLERPMAKSAEPKQIRPIATSAHRCRMKSPTAF